MMKTRCLIIIIISIFYASLSFSSLRDDFEKFKSGTFSYSFKFSCDNRVYKLEKKLFDEPKVYWKDGLDWTRLQSLRIKDFGITFDGLGYRGGISKSQVRMRLEVPIYNKVGGKSALDYFILDENNSYIPYGYIIDFYAGKMVAANKEVIYDYLTFDQSSYMKEQRYIPGYSNSLSEVRSLENHLILLNLEKRREMTEEKAEDIEREMAEVESELIKKKKEREVLLKKKFDKDSAIKKERIKDLQMVSKFYSNSIEIETTPGNQILKFSCFPID